jgi:MoaA/NifB/PqqE/SkfB family radical SAM enzyme
MILQDMFKIKAKGLRRKVNRLKSSLCFEKRVSLLNYPPFELFVEPTNVCNLRCPMCPRSAGLGRRAGFMDLNLYGKVIREAAEAGVERISIFMAGESLLHKGIVEMIKEAECGGLRTRLHTNATLLTEELSDGLIGAGLTDISFSFDGEDRATFERMRRGADYDKVLSNIKNFLERKKALNAGTPLTTIQVIKDYDPEKPPSASHGFKALFRGLPVDRFKAIAFQSFAGHLKDKDGFRYIPSTGSYTPCPQIWKRFVVGWDGRAIACCLDLNGKNAVGDAKRQTIMEIWNGAEFVGLREKLASGDYRGLEACRWCDLLWRKYPEKKDGWLKKGLKNAAWRLWGTDSTPMPLQAAAHSTQESSARARSCAPSVRDEFLNPCLK